MFNRNVSEILPDLNIGKNVVDSSSETNVGVGIVPT